MLGRVIGTLTILLVAKLIISEGQPAVPIPVVGIIGQSVHLPLPANQTGPEEEVIYWNFQNDILAHFTYNHLKIRNEKFRNRLETADNGRTLRITYLRKEDGGIYNATIHSPNKTTYNTSYNLTVYDPVPPVQITQEWKRIGDQCNITLKSSVQSNTSDLYYTWMYRHRDSQNQSTATTGNIMHIELPLDHQDMEYICIVRNPADQKNTSGLIEPCSVKMKKRNRMYVIIPAIVMPAVFGAILWKCWKRSSATSRRADNMETMEEERDTPVAEISPTSAAVQSEVADEEPVVSVSPASNISSTSTTLETGQTNSFSPGTTNRDAAASPGAATAAEPTAGHGYKLWAACSTGSLASVGESAAHHPELHAVYAEGVITTYEHQGSHGYLENSTSTLT